MTKEEAREAAAKAERGAHAAAKAMFPPGMSGMTSSIVQPARLAVLEQLMMGLMAERSQHEGDFETKALLELRDYWDAVADEIRS